MAQDKPPQRARFANITILALIVILAPIGLYATLTYFVGEPPQLFRRALPEVPPPGTAEVVTLALDGSATPTENRYQGAVRLVIVGNGQDASAAFRDAFYTYADADGFSLDTPQPEPLHVNGEPIAPPAYNPFHIYDVTVEAGPGAARLSFSVPAAEDGSGALTVYLVPLEAS